MWREKKKSDKICHGNSITGGKEEYDRYHRDHQGCIVRCRGRNYGMAAHQQHRTYDPSE